MGSRPVRCAAAGLAALVLLAGSASTALAGWEEPVGGESPINRAPTRGGYAPELTQIAGVPWVTWTEWDGRNYEIRVARLNAAGDDWEEVVGGPSPLNFSRGKDGKDPALVAVGGVPHVAWSEWDGANWEIRVARLAEDGTVWEHMGPQLSPVNHSPVHDAHSPSLSHFDGVPYVAWHEHDGQNHEVRVARLNPAGAAWEEIIGGPSPINRSPEYDGRRPQLVATGGEPYVAWEEWDGENYEIHVSEYEGGDAWESVGGDGPSPVNVSPARDAIRPAMAEIDGVWYVAWSEKDGVNFELRVARLNPDHTRWDPVPGSPSPINYSSSKDAFRPSLTGIGGVPVVAWTEADGTYGESDTTPYEVRIARLAPGGHWEPVVAGPSPVNRWSDGIASEPSLTAIGGVPYVSWREFDGRNSEVRVAHLEPEFLSTSTIANQTEALLLSRVRTFGIAYPIAAEHAPTGAPPARTAAQSTSPEQEDTIFTTIAGLEPGTSHTWRPLGFDGVRSTGEGPWTAFTTEAEAAPASPAPRCRCARSGPARCSSRRRGGRCARDAADPSPSGSWSASPRPSPCGSGGAGVWSRGCGGAFRSQAARGSAGAGRHAAARSAQAGTALPWKPVMPRVRWLATACG